MKSNTIPEILLSFLLLLQCTNSFARGASLQHLGSFESSKVAHPSERVDLENSHLQGLVFNPGDLDAESPFPDFLEPNEGGVIRVQKHLDIIRKGVLVSTGTERSFFDLLLCTNCTALVVRDINPHVKAYVDFNVLLLKISSNLREYNQFSSRENYFQPNYRKIIRLRTEESKYLTKKAKQYYLEHLDSLIGNYWTASGRWQEKEQFDEVNYHKQKHLFQKLQDFARTGSIIATIGNINDLRFLDSFTVAGIDSSNICNYALLDFNLKEGSHPLVIWTGVHNTNTTYRSVTFSPLLNSDRARFDAILNKWKNRELISSTKHGGIQRIVYYVLRPYQVPEEFQFFSGYLPDTLNQMEEADDLLESNPDIRLSLSRTLTEM